MSEAKYARHHTATAHAAGKALSDIITIHSKNICMLFF